MNLIKWTWHAFHSVLTGEMYPYNQCEAKKIGRFYVAGDFEQCCIRFKHHLGPHRSSCRREWK